MSNKPSNKSLSTRDLPRFAAEAGQSKVSQINGYLKQILNTHCTQSYGRVVLPSPKNLALFIKASPFEVCKALQDLRPTGYDYQYTSMDSDISIQRL